MSKTRIGRSGMCAAKLTKSHDSKRLPHALYYALATLKENFIFVQFLGKIDRIWQNLPNTCKTFVSQYFN